MRRLSIALSALFLLSPLAASAAYMTPSALMAGIQSGTPRSFSIAAHAQAPDDMFVSVWANGALQGLDPMTMQMKAKTTIDVVSGDFKVRAKGEMMVVDGMLYVKVASVDGSMNTEFSSVSAKFIQHKWIKTEFDMYALEAVENPAFSLSQSDIMEADETFNMTTKTEGNGGTTYMLTLKTDAAAKLALSIREALQDDSSVSDYFFPWRALAEGMHFDMTVKTNAKDAFLGSSYSMSTKGKESSFTLTGSEKPTAALNLKAPTDAMSLDEIGAMLMGEMPSYFDDTSSDMTEVDMMETPTEDTIYVEPSSFDSVDDTSYECEDPSTSALRLLSLQRDGTCPATKTSTRHAR